MSGPPLRAAIELTALQVEGWADRGIGRYVTGYAAAMDRAGAVSAGLLDPVRPPPTGLPPGLLFAGRVAWDGPEVCRRLAGPGMWHHVTIPFLGFETDPGRSRPGPWEQAGVPRATVLYDLIPLQAPSHYLPDAVLVERYRRRAEWVARSELVLAISERTRRDAIELLGCDPDRVVAAGVGVPTFFSPPDGTDDGNWAAVSGRVGDRPFLLTVTGSDVRKGADTAVAALGRLVERGYDLGLVVVGDLTETWRAVLTETAGACGVAERVVLLGAVSDDLLRACYRRAELTVLPSLAEGAGLPVLESAACATPAVASAGSALGDTAVSPAATFDPSDVDAIADTIAAAVDSPARRARILDAQAAAARHATWEAVTGRVLAAMAAAGSAGSGPTGPAAGASPPLARRLAVVGPAGAAAGVVSRLGPSEVDLHDPADGPVPLDPSAYDAYVYLLGPGDEAVRAVASRLPGWLWVADDRSPRPALEPLVRSSRGLVVADIGQWDRLRLALDPLAATPPVVNVSAAGDDLARRLGGGRS